MDCSKFIKFTNENQFYKQIILELKPQKRTMFFQPKFENLYVDSYPLLINFPFYQIFILNILKDNNKFILNSYDYNHILASTKPITSLENEINTLILPNVGIRNGRICIETERQILLNENDYANKYLELFWNTAGTMYIDDNLMSVKISDIKRLIPEIKKNEFPILSKNNDVQIIKSKYKLKEFIIK